MKLILEIIIQTFLAFFAILFVTRILGKEQISELTYHEYINGITFGSIAATLATEIDSHTIQHFIGLMLFGILTGLVSYISMKNRKFKKIIEGEPLLVIYKGKILEKNLKRIRYTTDHLNMLLRQHECLSPSEVEFALLETNGILSVFKTKEHQNVTLNDLGIIGHDFSIPTEIIIGGQIIYENLRKRKLSGKDLIKQLKINNLKSIEDIMYATVDHEGNYYIDLYKDNIHSNIDISEDNDNI